MQVSSPLLLVSDELRAWWCTERLRAQSFSSFGNDTAPARAAQRWFAVCLLGVRCWFLAQPGALATASSFSRIHGGFVLPFL